MRTLLVVLALGALSVATPANADRIAETCQGLPATIVDLDGGVVTGTAEDDVIVVSGPFSIDALGGDDVICVRGYLGENGSLVSGGTGEDSLEARASAHDDRLEVLDVQHLDVALGRGADTLDLARVPGEGDGGGRVVGGQGADRIGVLAREAVDADLEDQVLRLNSGVTFDLVGFEHARAISRRVTLVGDRRDNVLSGTACVLKLTGGRGDDHLVGASNPPEVFGECRTRKAALFGLSGDDRLSGTGGDDVLLGGPGNDSARGRAGDDRCVAEHEKGCER